MINIMNSSLIQLQARGGIDDNYIDGTNIF